MPDYYIYDTYDWWIKILASGTAQCLKCRARKKKKNFYIIGNELWMKNIQFFYSSVFLIGVSLFFEAQLLILQCKFFRIIEWNTIDEWIHILNKNKFDSTFWMRRHKGDMSKETYSHKQRNSVSGNEMEIAFGCLYRVSVMFRWRCPTWISNTGRLLQTSYIL